jgi:AcrR family transcriptional regulator
MDTKTVSAEEKIIQATIDCIEKYGLDGTTNRQIAKLAGLNNAAVNYYFRSKDALIQRCMEITLKNAFDLGGMPPMPGLPPQERCVAILLDLIEGGHKYPGITRAHFHSLVVAGRYEPLLRDRMNRFVEELAADLQARGCALKSDELKVALAQIVSAVVLVILAPKLFERQRGLDLNNSAARKAYVTRLVARLLG